MSRLTIFIIIGLISIGIITGVIEVSFHFDRLGDVPAQLTSLTRDGSLSEKVRSFAIRTKRAAERIAVRDPDQRAEGMLLNVTADAKRLQQLASDESKSPQTLLPQAELLHDSLDRLGEATQLASTDVLTNLRDAAQEAYTAAAEALQTLQERQEQFENVSDQFSRLSEKLRVQLERFNLAKGEPAFPATSPTSLSSPSPTAIPLRF